MTIKRVVDLSEYATQIKEKKFPKPRKLRKLVNSLRQIFSACKKSVPTRCLKKSLHPKNI